MAVTGAVAAAVMDKVLQIPNPGKLRTLLKRHSEDGMLSSALSVAVQRALHQIVDLPLVFNDPYALAIVGGLNSEFIQQQIPDCDKLSARYLRAYFSSRSRIVDDELYSSMNDGVSQLLICGAGLDTSRFRVDDTQLRIFELDHPNTQAWRSDIIRELNWKPNADYFQLPIDFAAVRIEEILRNTAFDSRHKSFFSILGLAPYLTRQNLTQLFFDIRQLSPSGSKIVFDFVIERNLLPPWKQAAHDKLSQRMESIGLPWRSSFDPTDLCRILKQIGFVTATHIDSHFINENYFPNRPDQLCVGKLAHLIIAKM